MNIKGKRGNAIAGPTDNVTSRFTGANGQPRTTPHGDLAIVKMDSSPGATKEVALFLPTGFDPAKPAVIMPYFHGHGGSISDALTRQKLAEQAAKSGKNIAFVIPQLGPMSEFNADFRKPENAEKFLNDSGAALAKLYTETHPGADAAETERAFGAMPVVALSYSGGCRATWQTLSNPRVQGAVLLDSMYNSEQPFIDFTHRGDKPFVSATYGESTATRTQNFAKNAARGTKVIAAMTVSHGEVVQNALGAQLDALTIPADGGRVTMAGVAENIKLATQRPQGPRT